ncbi:MAG TPA: carboxypeptidase-like regulatory domain-containing protein [Bryobacteraceae bacterium]|jgi:hypothetical protein
MKTLILIAAVASVALAQTTVPAPATGNVTLSLDEYNKLMDLAGQPQKKAEGPPFRHVLKSADLNLEVKGDSVSGSVVLEGELLVTGESKVPLLSGMIVLDAQQSGKDLPFEQANGTHYALLAGPGDFAVALQTAIPLNVETGRASFSFPAPASGTARMTLTVPGNQTQMNLSPGLITSRSSVNGQTTIEATLVPGEMTNIWWASRLAASAAPTVPKEVRFLSDIKTLISVSEGDLAVAALADITVIQGEPSQFRIEAPEGYVLTGATGPTLLTSDVQANRITVTVSDPALRAHQFLISLSKDTSGTKANIPLLTFEGTQRETGEVLIEGEGAMDLTATETAGLRRMDVKETSPYLRSLAHATLHAAFRYQKRPAEVPVVALEWVRFPESQVLAAIAQKGVVTTLVTTEGRSLTEVKLTIKNKSQPFLKLDLPAGATILSSEVSGEKVKPVQATDGSRVPLLRPGFHPADSYQVSFVLLQTGAPFAKKGDAELVLPKMDIPVGDLEWEVFLPQRYKVGDFGGNPVAASLLPPSSVDASDEPVNDSSNLQLPMLTVGTRAYPQSLIAGQVGGVVTDPAGGSVSGAAITVEHLASKHIFQTFTDPRGRWVASNIPAGRIRISSEVPGFKKYVREMNYDASHGEAVSVVLQVGAASESVTVTAEATLLKTESGELSHSVQMSSAGSYEVSHHIEVNPPTPASVNVADLQRRVAGVLPIAVNVPRTGNSYHFVRPLVIDEETRLTFKYRSK